MESRQRNSWWTVGMGSVAMALLLLGGTAAFADGQQCYSCGSWCQQQGAIYGMWYDDNAPNTPPHWVRVGGTGWANCGPGTNCFFAVSAACTQQCDRCLAAGGHYGGPGHEESFRDCDNEQCSIFSGYNGELRNSVCLDFCLCVAGKYCLDTKIADNGIVTTQNYACRCPP